MEKHQVGVMHLQEGRLEVLRDLHNNHLQQRLRVAGNREGLNSVWMEYGHMRTRHVDCSWRVPCVRCCRCW